MALQERMMANRADCRFQCNVRKPIHFIKSRSWETFSVKGQIVDILVFMSHTVFVIVTRVCHCDVKAAIEVHINLAV